MSATTRRVPSVQTPTGPEIGGLIGILGLTGFQSDTVINSYATGTVSGSSQIGGLVGVANNASIVGSYASGSVTGGGSVGGLIGNVGSGSGVAISKCHSSGPVVSTGALAGGLIGSMTSGSVSSSYSSSTVSVSVASSQFSGLVGYMQNSIGSPAISDSYATGNVNAPLSSNVGGLVGRSLGSRSTISNSYSTGYLSGASSVGGLLGGCVSCGAITNSYWNIDIYPTSTSGGTGYNTGQLQTQSTYVGWDFTSVWNPPSSGNYPTLR